MGLEPTTFCMASRPPSLLRQHPHAGRITPAGRGAGGPARGRRPARFSNGVAPRVRVARGVREGIARAQEVPLLPDPQLERTPTCTISTSQGSV